MSGPINTLKTERRTRLKMTDTSAITPATVTDVVSEVLRRTFASVKGAPKILARKIDANVRTAENLLEGNHAPSSAVLIKLMREHDEVFEAVLALAGRDLPADHQQIKAIKAAIAIMEGKSP
jgi:hypothetical protein